ncbi:uncharacterized protein AMSG_12187 [Thecamonas trahens ATCC 50062]|uniref:CCHC-type domain-containing protein n=1 Tax=Thecamonas trahens ATCC 50062 TaxID=461836 RepID=A0A0L0DJY7_THETB|nr:hypothetical protein AMSG_12187 [Thecamonas trahens ATCC 50062]KNC52719.1 hypothetical protein AMSG_12187 [Thecamonas trahens ATCC 50062]|eukprot:XP_013755129.1 hypothetical protein AMSG_12187 [Thecamonas trahens ATCC 50062]
MSVESDSLSYDLAPGDEDAPIDLQSEVENMFDEDMEAEQVLAKLMRRHNRYSQSFANKVVRETNRHNFLHSCLTCSHMFDSWRQLKQHLIREKHIKSGKTHKAQQRQELEELDNRVRDKDPDDYSPAELRTMHAKGRGAAWTSRHAPLELVEERLMARAADEDALVKEYMAQHGIENVRGGAYSSVTLSHVQAQALVTELWHAEDRCLGCGNQGHYVRDCPADSESYDTESDDSPSPPPARVVCYACGETGHVRPACRYKSATWYTCGVLGHIAPVCPLGADAGSGSSSSSPEVPLRSSRSSRSSRTPSRTSRSSGVVCFACGRSGHVRPACRYKSATCYSCGEYGHIVPACPNT